MTKNVTEEHEKHIQEFLESFATAMLSWQSVEERLFFIFSALIGARSPEVASAAFYSVINLSTRLGMINAILPMELALKPDLVDRWEKLKRRIGKASARRNRLAHLTVAVHTDHKDQASLRLRPSQFQFIAPKDQDYDIKQINDWKLSFGELAADLLAFGDDVERVLGAP